MDFSGGFSSVGSAVVYSAERMVRVRPIATPWL